MPIRLGDGTAIDPKGIQEVRLGDGTVLWSGDGGGGTTGNQYYWSAENHAVGDIPAEWTVESNATIEIMEDADGNNYLDVSSPSSTAGFVSYTEAEDAVDGEVWCRFLTDSGGDIWSFLRGQNLSDPSSTSNVRIDYNPNNDNERLSEYVNGSFNDLTTQPITTTPGTIGQMRGSFNGDTAQGRWWDDGATEPDTWDLTATTNVTSSGATGVGQYLGGDIRIYEFGVGTVGEPAPTGPV